MSKVEDNNENVLEIATESEMARELKIDRSTLSRLRRSGELPQKDAKGRNTWFELGTKSSKRKTIRYFKRRLLDALEKNHS
jgi:hypothetical protein